ncbi:BapA/Bap/LapF family large adhesin [Acinetobacter soli]|uniref:BapA/Bap/LapF family large adhesin n=1 Tax=Acinetobacter soli TaxID=487316 RepID=UPI003F8390E2
MPNIQIIAKESHAVLADITGNSAKLTEASVVLVKVSADDVQEVTRDGTSAIIKLKNGEVIVIDDFFSTEGPTDNSLVFQDDSNKLIWVQFTDAQGALLENVAYQPIDSIEPLLYGHSETNPWAWAAVPVTAGGILWWAHNRDSDNDNNNPPVVNPPATPTTPATVFDDKEPITGNVSNGSSTNDASPLISGTGTAGTTITVYDGNTVLGTTTVGSDGKWSFTPTTPLTDGTHSITYTVKDAAGNESGKSPAIDFTVDTIAPDTPTTAPNATDDVAPVIGPITAGSSTNDNTPTLTGTGTAGDIITVYDGATKLGTATVGSDGKWSFTPSPALADGSHSISYTATDKAGNESGKSPAIDFTVDTIAPDTPTTAPNATDDVAPVIGPITAGSSTNDNTPTLTGTGTAGDIITVYDGATKLGTATVGSDGKWSFTPSPALADGSHSISYTATDKAGNESGKSPAIDFTVDTIAPDTPTTAPNATDDVAPVIGPITAGSSTNDNTPTLTGTGTAGDIITVYDGATKLGTATVGSDGKWSFTPSPALADGSHSISYTATDKAGNESGKSPAIDFTVDTIPPLANAVTVLDLYDDVGAIQGTISNSPDSLTDDTRPAYSGTADASVAIVKVYDNGAYLGSATVGADGKWSFTPSTPIGAGPHSFTASGVDAAGNEGPQSAAWQFKVVGAAPSAPSIQSVTDNQGDVTGDLQKNQTTDDRTPTISGTGQVGAVVTVYVDGTAVGSTTVASDGTWSVTTTDLGADGTKNLIAKQTDGAGQSSPDSGAYPIVLDTTAPATPTTAPTGTDDQAPVIGPITSGGSTNDSTPTIAGTGTAGNVITIKDGNTVLGSTTVASDGTWSFTPNTPLTDGSHSIGYTEKDPAGNESGKSPTLNFNLDTTNVVVSINKAVDNVGSKVGDLANNAATDDTTPTLVGTGTAGAIVTISVDGGAAVGSAVVDSSGNWSYTLPTQSEGSHSYTATASNAAGTQGSASFNLTIDTTAPSIPSIGLVSDDVGLVQGPLGNGASTDDTTPTLSGTGATPGDVIKVYDGNDVVGSVTVGADGRWNYTIPAPGLTEGPHNLSVTATDPVGNESGKSDPFTVNVDLTAPTATASLVSITQDTGSSGSDFVTSDNTLVFNLSTTGTLASGEYVQISLNGGATWINAVQGSGNSWSYDNTGNTLADGSYSIQTRVVDAAGNTGTAATQVIVVDTQAPTTDNSISLTGYADDVAPNTGDFGTGTTTNDTSPLLKGTVTGLKEGDSVQIYEGTTLLGTATVTGGSFSYQLSNVSEGPHSYTAAIVDQAGNVGTTSTSFNLTVDTIPPLANAVTVLDLYDDVGAIQGTISNSPDSLTDDTRPAYSGTADASVAIVKVYDNGAYLGSATVGADGKWSFTPSTPIGAGPHSFTASGVDAAGNEGPQSAAWQFKVVGAAPSAPSIQSVTDNQGDVTGDLQKNQTTDDRTPTISGTGQVGAVVTVYVDGTAVGSTTVASDGTWSVTTTDLGADGTKNLIAKQTDGAGQSSPDSGAYPIVLDTTAPVKPGVVTAIDDQGQIQGPITNNGTTDDKNPEFKGTGTAGDVITIKDGTTVLGSTTVASDGTWSFTPSTGLADGAHSITTTATDAAGNTSAASDALNFTVDTTNVVVSINKAVDNVGSKVGDLANNAATDDTTPTLVGTGTAGAIVTISVDGGAAVGSAVVDSSGNWSYTLPTQSEGSHSYTATASNAAGTQGSASFNLTIDTTAPSIPSIGLVSDDVGLVQGPLGNGASTDDTTPTLSGTGATPGDVIKVYDGNDVVGSVTVGADGRWNYTIPAPGLTEGPHNLSVTATDPVGNESGKSDPFTVNVDLTAPTATASLVSITQDTGSSGSDFVTSDNTLVFNLSTTGTLASGEYVQISLNGGATWINAVQGSGNSWSYDNTGNTLADGSYSIQTRVVDAAGNTGTAATQVIVVDTQAPTTDNSISLTGYADDVAPNTGDFGTGTTTNDTSPLLKGTVTGLKEGDSVQIYEGTTLLGTATVTGGSFSYQLSNVSEGPHSYTAAIVDQAGNVGTTSTSFNLTVDTIPPLANAVTVLDLYDDVGAIQGTISNSPDSLTDDTRPAYSGTADASVAIVKVYDNGAYLGSATVGADGKWSFTPSTPIGAGPHSFTASGVDAAGNEGPQSAAWQFKVVGAAPSAPSIQSVTDNQGDVTGDLQKNQTTDDRTPTISGTGQVGAVVTVYVDGTAVGSTTVASDGTWSVTTTDLGADGTKNLIAKQTDGAGQSSPDSGAYPIVLDTTAPVKPGVVTAIDDQGQIQGPIANNGTTDDKNPEFKGTGTAGDVITIKDGTTVLGSTTVASDGTWSFTPSTGLADGAHSITTTATDAAGNTSAASDALNFTVDTTNVVVSINKAVDNVGSKVGDLANNAATDDTTPTLVGTGTAGAIVTISVDGGAAVGSAVVDSSGNWSYTLPTQSEGSHSYTATASNAAGTQGSASFNLTIDTTAPSIPSIGLVSDDVGLVQGPLGNGASTDDTTPTLSGTGATPGDVIKVYDGNDVVGSVTVGADGRWNYTIPAPGLTEGPHNLSVTATDPVGNESGKSDPFTVNVDLTAPTATASLVSITQDTGSSGSDFVTSDNTLVFNLSTTGTLASGEYVQISLNGGATWINAVQGSGNSWSYDNTGNTLADGSYSIQTRVVDAAGNTGTAATQVIVVDTQAPTTDNSISLTGYADDVAPNTGDFGTGTTTNDTSPLLKGTVTGLKEGDSVQIYEGTTLLGTATVTGGSFSYQLSNVSEGPHSYTAAIVDQAGNVGTTSTSFNLTVDTIPPLANAVTVLDLYDDVGAIQGTISNSPDSLTDDTRPAYSGTADASVAIVKVYDNGAYLGSATVGADGKWSFTPSTPIGAGPHSFTASGVDAAGNEGPQSAAWQFKVVGAAPSAPSIQSVTDNQGDVTGDLQKNQTTDDRTPTISGTGQVGAVVTVYVDGTAVGSTTVASDGTWSVTTTDLGADGTKNLIAKQTDGAGQSSPDSGAYPIVLDTTAPVKPGVVTAIDDQGQIQGPIANNGTTDDKNPEFKGTGTAGDVITIKDGTTVLGSTTVASDGTWSFTPSTGLADGAHSITTTATDAAGNTSAASDALNFTVDTTNVVVSINKAVDNVGSKVGDLANNAATDDTTPTLVGTGTAGAIVTISVDGGAAVGSAVVDSSGNWSYTLPTQSEGSHSYTATASNAAGTQGSASFNLTIDTTAPSIPSIGLVSDDVGLVQGPLGNGASTDDTTPTLSGTGATPGDVIKVYDGNDVVGSVTVGADGRWNYTIPAPGLTEGPHNLSVTATDPVGNESGKSDPFTVNVDLTAPTATASLVSITQDTGSSGSDFVTSDNTLVFNLSTTGTLASGEYVQISLNGGATWINAVQGSGNSWSYDNTGNTLADGSYSIQTRVVDAAGNTGTAATQVIVVDTQAPTTDNSISLTGYADDVAPNTGDFGTGTTTNDTSPLLKGTVTGLKEGDSVQIYEGTTLLGTATVTGGSFSYQLSNVSEGPHSYTAAIVDQAGNVGTTSTSFNLTVDTIPPLANAVTVLDLYDDVGAIQGTISNSPDSLTDDTRPAYSGTADASVAIVKVYDNGAYLGSATVGADGKWSFTPSTPIGAGPHSFTASGVDAAGNEGPQSAAWQFKVVGAAPSAPSIQSVTDNQGDVTGDLQKNQTTDDRTPTISGTGQVGAVVTVYVDGTAVGSTTVASDGTWSVTTTDLGADGTKNLIAKQTDGAGQSSPDSGAYPIVLDTTAPVKPGVVTAIDDQGQIQGPIANNGTTDDKNPEFKGTGTAGDVITIKDGTTVLGSTTVASDGTWSFTPSTGLADGAHSITTTATDAAGNTSAASDALNFTVDTTNVVVSINKAVDNVGSKVGDLANNAATDDTTPTLVGTGTAGAIVTISVDGGAAVGSAVVDSSGNWSYTLPTQSEGSHSYTATASNAAGTQGSASFNLTIDTTAPSIPSIGLVSDDVGLVQGPLGNGASTDDTTPTLSGTGATPGDVIKVYDGNDVVGSVTVGADGRWNYTIPAPGLTEGPHNLSVTATDPVGNESGKSDPFNLTVDLTPPNAPSGTFNASGSEITGSAEIGSVVKVKDANGNVLGSATADSSGKYTVTFADPLDDAEKVKITATDKAGNESQATDLTAPNIVIDAKDNIVEAKVDFTYPVTVNPSQNIINESSLINIGTSTYPGYFTVGQDQIADAVISVSTGSLINLFDKAEMKLYKQQDDGSWKLIADNKSPGLLDLLGIFGQTTKVTAEGLTPGNYRFDFTGGSLVGLGTSIKADLQLTTENTAANPVVSGITSKEGNVITDNDQANGQDQVTSQTKVTAVNGQTVAADGSTTTVIGEHGTLTIKADGSYKYTPTSNVNVIGKTDVFTYTITDTTSGKSDTAKLIVQIGTNSDLDLTWNPNNPEADATSVVATNNEDTVGIGATNTETTVTGPSINQSWLVGLGGSQTVASQTITIAQGNLGAIEIGLSTSSLASLGGAASVIFQKLVNNTWTTVDIISANSLVDLIGLFPNGNGKVYDDLEAGEYRYVLNYNRGVGLAGNVSVSSEVTSTDLDAYTVTSRETVKGNILTEDTGAGVDKVASQYTDIAISNNGSTYSTVTSTGTTIQGAHGTLVIKSDGSYTYTPNTTLTGGGEDQFTYKLIAPNGDESTATLKFNAGFVYNTSAGADIITSSAGDDTFTTNAGADKVIFNLLNNTDATGGNGHDTWTDFSKAQGDKVDISALLTGQSVTASNIANYVTVTKDGADTVISIDRDGTGTTYQSTELLTLKNVNTTLDELLQNNHLIY